MGSGKGGSVFVHVGTNNVEREVTNAIVMTLKHTRVEQVMNAVMDFTSNRKDG